MKSNMKGLCFLANKSGKHWIHLYENNQFSIPSYLVVYFNGGKSFKDKREAADFMVKKAQEIGGMRKVNYDEETETYSEAS